MLEKVLELKLLHGGAQERNRRGGTENVPGIVGLATALELAIKDMDENNKKCLNLEIIL